MEATTINATELRTRTREIIERARFKGERFLVRNFGKPVAVIISVEEYAGLLQRVREIGLPVTPPSTALAIPARALELPRASEEPVC